MRLLTRYVLREIGQVFLVTLVSLTGLMILIGAVREAVAQGLGAPQIIQLLPYLLPNALVFAVPGTILFSVSSVYGRMSGANEIIVLKSLGIHPMIVIWPALALAVVLSFATVWLNDLAMSWGFHGVQRVVIDSIEDIAYGMLRSHHAYNSPKFSVTVQRVKGRRLVAPVFSLPSGDGSGPVTVRAESAELRSNPGSGKLLIALYNGRADGPGFHAEFPNQQWVRELEIHPEGAGAELSPAHLALAQIPGCIVRQKEIIQQCEQKMIAQTGTRLATGDFDSLGGGSWAEEERNLHFQKLRLYRMQTELPRRWANGFSCLCFALVGSAMAIRRRNADMLTSFFLCFGPILLVYYPFLFFGVDRAKAGAINPYAVWLANLTLMAWGLWLLRRVIRY